MSKKRNNKPRMALVPQSPIACEQCLMLASRGFVYSYEFNPHGHKNHNCRCKFIVGDKNTRIEGYSEKEYYRRWKNVKNAREKLGYSIEQMTALYERVPIDDTLNIVVDTFVENVRKCAETVGTDEFAKVLEEAMTRTSDWLYRGIPAEIDYSGIARDTFGILANPGVYDIDNFVYAGNEWRDLFIHDTLSNNGIRVKPRKPDAPAGYSNIDSFVNGRLCEFKSPQDEKGAKSSSTRFVDNNFKSARRQFENQYDPEKDSVLQYDEKRFVVLNMKYKDYSLSSVIDSIPRYMNIEGIDEVIVIADDGRMKRFKK